MTKTFHYTFRTYKGKQVLVGDIAFELVASSILTDHVHLLIEKGQGDSNEYVMKMIKGISSREIFKKYPSNRFEFRKLWGRGYHAIEIKDQASLDRATAYINSQKIDGIDKRFKPGWKPRRSVSGFQPPAGFLQQDERFSE